MINNGIGTYNKSQAFVFVCFFQEKMQQTQGVEVMMVVKKE
jgi:hypothetical protein